MLHDSNYMTVRKDKTMRTVKRSAVPGPGGEMNRRARRIFRAMKILRMTPKWWTRVITHLSKPVGCVTPTVNPKVNRSLRRPRPVHADPLTVTDAPSGWGGDGREGTHKGGRGLGEISALSP